MHPHTPAATLTPLELPNATARDGTSFTKGDMVTVRVSIKKRQGFNRRAGLVRRIYRLGKATYAHLHWTCSSAAASSSPFLQHMSCKNVEVKYILRVAPGELPQFVTEVDRVWRDPLPPGRHRPSETSDPFCATECDSCLSKKAEAIAKARQRGNRFMVRGEICHVGELVFIDSAENTGEAWGVGIVSLELDMTWEVRMCGRYSDLEGGGYVSQRALYLTDEVAPCNVHRVVGKAPVNLPSNPESFTLRKRLPSGSRAHRRFLVDLDDPPTACSTCYSPESERDRADFDQLRLPCVELYAGGGGSLFGFNKHFEVQSAVEINPAACQTLKTNFPDIKVHQRPVAEFSKSSRAPKPGSVAVLVAGPPCQGHTTLNVHASPSDPRNEEIFVTLEEVKRVQPDVFVLENVRGMKEGKEDDPNFAHEVVRHLVGMRYQVRVALLHSRDYGSPQRRVRLFFLAARSGIQLPPFPLPTHANPDARGTKFGLDSSVAFGLDVGRVNGTAALPAVTSYDALADMPAWDHPPYPKLRSSGQNVVGPKQTAYRHRPMNDFQREARRHSEVLRDHLTPMCSQRELEFIVNAPPPGEDQGLHGGRKRLHPLSGVPTLLTSPRPGQKATTPIHWSQNRIFTVAERRRIQGLPDSYVLRGTVDERNKQLGNMIDVAVASAVAKSIKSIFEGFWRQHGKPDSATFWILWREAHPL